MRGWPGPLLAVEGGTNLVGKGLEGQVAGAPLTIGSHRLAEERGVCTPEVERELDRRAAIERAIGLAGEGDVVVVAGKGHESYQELAGGVKVPFDDRAVAREALRARLVA